VNPYVSVTIAMCVIVAVALAATAYMAVYFNRRAKADLNGALKPLAEVIAGDVDLDEATVTGRFEGHLSAGKVAQQPGGMGRVFQTLVIDGAGGGKWVWTVSRSKQPGGPEVYDYEGPDGALKAALAEPIRSLAGERSLAASWLRVEYDPAPGHVRLSRPMRTRRDLPGPEAFRSYLQTLVAVADVNRSIQHGHD
jgi:hypothetical protein